MHFSLLIPKRSFCEAVNWESASWCALDGKRQTATSAKTLSIFEGAYQGGRPTTCLLRRVLRRVLETSFEKVLIRVLRRHLAVGFRERKGSEKGSWKGF